MSSYGADQDALEKSLTRPSPINIAVAEDLLREVKQIMTDLGVVFFLRQGTCLGAIRDNALIAWDDDLDIGSIIGLHGLNEETMESTVSAFRSEGFFADVNESETHTDVSLMKHSTRVDWSCFRNLDGTIYHYPGIRIPVSLFSPLKEVDFIGAKFLVPDPPEEYLRHKYGAEWVTPKEVGFERDVLEMVPDTPLPGRGRRLRHLVGMRIFRSSVSDLRVLDDEGEAVSGAEVSIAGVGRSRTNGRGVTRFRLPGDGWYAMTVTYDDREELLYQERMARGRSYVYRPDSSVPSGRVCALSSA